MTNIRNFVQKTLECADCGTKQKIWRKKNKNQPSGHIKHLYCCVCKKRTEHLELKNKTK